MAPLVIGREFDRFMFLFNTLNDVSSRIDRVNGVGCSVQHFKLNSYLQMIP